MKRILITGATGNTGFEVIKFLFAAPTKHEIIAGVRNVEKAKGNFSEYPELKFAKFDFEAPETFDGALQGIDTVFLLRPPHISDVKRFFEPLVDKIKEKGVREVVFLSVQGADTSSFIPHHKIEKLLFLSGLDYIFLRPGYFMQNLTTTLHDDIRAKRKIILPAAKAKFNWIDVENIGETSAIVLDNFEAYKNNAYDLTGYENLDFATAAQLINEVTEDKIKFHNVSPFKFYRIKKRDGMKTGLILVMIMLHFLPRFGKEPRISDFYETITGKKPTTLKAFISRERGKFISQK